MPRDFYRRVVEKKIDTISKLGIIIIAGTFWRKQNEAFPPYFNGTKKMRGEDIYVHTIYTVIAAYTFIW